MFLEIVTPEAVVFSSEIVSVSVPSIDGEFQMLSNHAPIVSLLVSGLVKIEAKNSVIKEEFSDKFSKNADGKFIFKINSGTLEMKDNKAIVLAD